MKYVDISDDVTDDIMEWAVMCATRDWLIWTRDWDRSWAVWSQSLVSAKDWSKKWSDPMWCLRQCDVSITSSFTCYKMVFNEEDKAAIK